MDVVVESSSEEDRSSSSDSDSSNEDLADFFEANINIDGIQGYQFQPRRDSYTGDTSESDGDEEKANLRLSTGKLRLVIGSQNNSIGPDINQILKMASDWSVHVMFLLLCVFSGQYFVDNK